MYPLLSKIESIKRGGEQHLILGSLMDSGNDTPGGLETHECCIRILSVFTLKWKGKKWDTVGQLHTPDTVAVSCLWRNLFGCYVLHDYEK